MPTIAEPLHLTPLLVPKPWGGHRLVTTGAAGGGAQLAPGTPVGERWEVADLPSAEASGVARPSTRVATGPFAGASLGELIADARADLLGPAADHFGRFPLLVKLLDVREPLSVQVHPPAAYVARHPEVALKMETWIVLDAEPGAELLVGLADGADLEQLRAVAGTPELVGLLRRVPAKVGAVHHLPAGTIHAVGAGVLLAEVQTPSDTTFRLYDWSQELGRAPRQLHLDEAVEALELAPGDVLRPGDDGDALPLDAGHYRLERHHLDVEATRDHDVGALRVINVVEGELDGDGFAWSVRAGASVVLPAAWVGQLWAAASVTSWLEVTFPDEEPGV